MHSKVSRKLHSSEDLRVEKVRPRFLYETPLVRCAFWSKVMLSG